MRVQLDGRHGIAEFDDASRHVVCGGDEAETPKTFRPHPEGGFVGIAEGVVGFMTERNAAIRLARRLPRQTQQLLHINTSVDA